MNNKSKGCLVMLVILLAVIIIAFAMCSGGDKETLPDDLTAEEAFVAEIVGYKTNHTEDELKIKLIDVRFIDDTLAIQLIGNDNLSTSFIRRGMWMDSRDLFKAAFDEYPETSGVAIIWYFPLVDKLGNGSLDEVMRIGLDRATAETINWDNFLTDNLPDVADSYWQHPALD